MEVWNFLILFEDSDTRDPSLVAVRRILVCLSILILRTFCGKTVMGRKEALFCDFFFLQGCFQCRWVRVGAVSFIYQSAVTNSMHLHSTYTPHLQYLKSEAYEKSSQTAAVELFSRNSQRVNAIGYFCRRAPSCIFDRMFDRILNATLSNILL